MEVVRLRSADWERLKNIRLAALEDSPDAFASNLESNLGLSDLVWIENVTGLPTFVLVNGTLDDGMVRCAPDKKDPADMFVISMWVAPRARGKGVASMLMQAAIQWAERAGYRRLHLDVADNNVSAIALYEKFGFKPTGERGALPAPRQHVLEHRRTLLL